MKENMNIVQFLPPRTPEPSQQLQARMWSTIEQEYLHQQHRSRGWLFNWKSVFATGAVAMMSLGIFVGVQANDRYQTTVQLNALDAELTVMEENVTHDQVIEQVIAGESFTE